MRWWGLMLCLMVTPVAWAQTVWPNLQVHDTCVIGWTAPTLNADASPLTDLDEFRICIAASAGGACTNTVMVSAATTQQTCAQLGLVISANVYFIRVYAQNTANGESAASPELQVQVTAGRTFMRP
jgi:hypothetical protein